MIIIFLLTGTLYLAGQPALFKVKKLSFSTSLSNEIAPVIYSNGIIFCSDRKISSISDRKSFRDERLYNLYYVERTDSNKWKGVRRITETDSALLFYGPMSIASDGKTVYFTSSMISGKAAMKKGILNTSGIFSGTLSGTKITNVHSFRYNSRDYNTFHPFIRQDGKYLFFASDRPGGSGESDIYYSENVNGNWAEPVNLGPKVNSKYKEGYPYQNPSGRLYFTSNRPSDVEGTGKSDIYYTTLIFGEWETPVLLPPPVNSPSDDFSFVASDNLQTGYFSRRDGRDDDIYSFESTVIRKARCDTMQMNSYCYEFFEENAIRFDTIPFKYIWNFGDGTSAEGMRVEHCFTKQGDYKVTIDVMNMLTKEVSKAEKTFDLQIRPVEQPYISAPAIANAGALIKLDADSTYLPGWNITSYYWNFDDMSVNTGNRVEHSFQRPGSYLIQLIVTATPDANGAPREACVTKKITITRRP
ncbi:MAG: PKD domain-containing protein [Bacteroidales bacterium]